MLTFLSHFFSGEVAPFWPHVILLSVSVLASFAVGAGIILESPKYPSLHRIATRLVIAGVIVEAACTIFLFVFDEGISNAQQEKIIALENRLAARFLSDEQIRSIAILLKQFNEQHFDIVTYWKNPESLALTNRIYDALLKAGWKYDKPTNGEFILGVQTGVVVWRDDRSPVGTVLAVKELIEVLNANNVATSADDTPQNHGNEPMTQKIVINVGIKP